MTSGLVSRAREPKAVKIVLRGMAAVLMMVALPGCGVPTRIIEHRHWELNQAIRRTSTEQLLLNIVRLRYDEMPYFLQVSSINTQFSTQQGATACGNLSGSFPRESPETYGAGLWRLRQPNRQWPTRVQRTYLQNSNGYRTQVERCHEDV